VIAASAAVRRESATGAYDVAYAVARAADRINADASRNEYAVTSASDAAMAAVRAAGQKWQSAVGRRDRARLFPTAGGGRERRWDDRASCPDVFGTCGPTAGGGWPSEKAVVSSACRRATWAEYVGGQRSSSHRRFRATPSSRE